MLLHSYMRHSGEVNIRRQQLWLTSLLQKLLPKQRLILVSFYWDQSEAQTCPLINILILLTCLLDELFYSSLTDLNSSVNQICLYTGNSWKMGAKMRVFVFLYVQTGTEIRFIPPQ